MTDLAEIKVSVDTRQVKQAQADIKGLGNTAQDVEKQTKQSADGMSSSFDGVSGAVKALGGILAAVGIGTLIKGFADTVMESERLKGALTTMTGSADNAAFAFSELTRFASETPFTLDQSVQGFIKLQALGLDPSERALRSYGNTASAMGKDMMQMIEAVADASTGEFERLKEFGIKAKKEGDNVSLTFQGVTTNIGNNSAEIQEYLLGIGEVQFGTAMADQMQRLPGMLSNLQDNIGNLFRTLGDSGGVKIFGSIIAAASTGVVLLTDNVDILITGVQAFAAAFAVIAGPAAIVSGFAAIRAAVIGLNTVIMANPIAAVAAATAAAAVLIYKNWDSIALAAQKAWLSIQISFNEFRIYLIENFGLAADALALIFGFVKGTALGVWSAIKTGAGLVVDGFNALKIAAEKVAINIEIAWTSLKDFLGSTFGTALTAIMKLFDDVKNKAIATWTAVVEATKNPLSAVETFNTTFSETLTKLENAEIKTNAFSTSAASSRQRVEELQAKLAALNTTTETAATNIANSDRSLSDFAITASSSETEISALTTSINAENEALKATDITLGEVETSTGALSTAAAEAAKSAEENWQRTHEYLSSTFIDIFNNGKGAFSNIADSFTAMIKRMVAEWAASKLMNLFGIGSGSGATASSVISGLLGGGGGGGGSVTGSVINQVLGGGGGGMGGVGGSIVGAAGQFIGGLTGTAVGTGSAIVGPPTAAAAAGSGIGSSIMGAIGSIPGWGWALAGVAAAAALLAKDETPSTNAGMLVGPAPGASADRTFAVAPFASGFQPTGFARREDQGSALAVIDAFAAVDAKLTEAIRNAGGSINMSAATLSGFSETGQGDGVFLGMASEKGQGITSIPIEQQLERYARDVMRHASGLTEAQKEMIYQGVHGSHANGLAMVPFDGYRAELHKGEEVLRADDPRNQNNQKETSSKLDALTMQVALYTKRFSEILDDWDVRGLPAERPA